MNNLALKKRGYWKHVENIQKEYLVRDRVVLYVIDDIFIHMNPDGDSDGECESSDTEDRSDCSLSEDMDLKPPQSL